MCVSIDGEQIEVDDAAISVFDRGFLYGDSVFEVLRSYGGFPFALSAHLERLERSAERLEFRLPVRVQELASEVVDLLDASDLRDAYIRVIVTRGEGPLTFDPTTAKNPRRVVIVGALPAAHADLRDHGGALELVPTGRSAAPSSLSEAKASNYLANLLAVGKVKERGGDEALFVGLSGEILEGASSNVFVVRDGSLMTPRAEGILPGITRATILKLGAERFGPPVERLLFPRDLYDADEVFITSSIREVIPIVRVDGVPVGDATPGPITRSLQEAFHQFAALNAAREGRRS